VLNEIFFQISNLISYELRERFTAGAGTRQPPIIRLRRGTSVRVRGLLK